MSIVSGIDPGALGHLARIVMEFGVRHDRITRGASASGISVDDWAPLAELVAVDEFRRVGAYLEEMNWPEYLQFLTKWAGETSFDSTLKRVSEAGRVVYYEIEERHFHGEEKIVKNVIAVYVFNEGDKICHLDIYEQARDSGQWIVAAARSVTEGECG